MRVLWFEVRTPSNYEGSDSLISGWQDSLEAIVKKKNDIELYIVFEGKRNDKQLKKENVTYIPIPSKDVPMRYWLKNKVSWDYNAKVVSDYSLYVINQIHPDVIHIFGMEWSWAHIVGRTSVPCAVHVMGSIVPYYNALYPPSYSSFHYYKMLFPNIKKMFDFWCAEHKSKSWMEHEMKKWKIVNNYMGRTAWDHSLVDILHPGANYFHVDEAIRPTFLETNKRWQLPSGSHIRLLSVGCSSFWKGPDVMLKTAYILKEVGVDFEWFVIGKMDSTIKKMIEKKEKKLFEDNNISILGYLNPDSIVDHLCNCTLYVHTAYIENSPNSICEAQLLGVPIVSTNVGGISTLVGNDGFLVPANDPWQLANAIIKLSHDKDKMKMFSENGMAKAQKRHNPDLIMEQLMNCYIKILAK